jgi:hypothetical protein
LLLLGPASAAAQLIEDIRVTRSGNMATVTIDLACPMRFQSDIPTGDGLMLEVRVAPLEDCRQLGIGSGFASERTRPVGGQLAHLLEVEYESLGLGDNLIMFHFDRPVEYEVEQRGGLRSILLTIRLDPSSEALIESVPERPLGSLPAATTEPQPRGSATSRPPAKIRVREPGSVADYVINLQSTRESVSQSLPHSLDVPADRVLYVSKAEIDGTTWYRLRLGFFESEAEAREALEQLGAAFPRAWIGRAESREVESAGEYGIATGAVFDATADDPDQDLATATVAESGAGALAPERVAELMEEAREAMLNEDFDLAIRIYTRVLQDAGPHRAQAREFLGVARERNGQLAHARAEYEAYLEEFGEEQDAQRVRQRLNGLVTVAAVPREPLRAAESATNGRWDFGSGISQYFRHHVNQFDEEQQEIVTFSALLTDVDLSFRRRGEKLDVTGRTALSHFYDLMEDERLRPVDENRVSYAYVDLDSIAGSWSLQLGRQSLHNWGVLGRFDGFHFTYDWNEGRRVHYTAGYPVESTRNSVITDREFHGVAVEFDDLVGRWDFATYLNGQTIEGIDDRQAVGLEIRYLDERRSVTGMLDYDVKYGELNTALMLGTWRFPSQTTLSVLVDRRMSPFLTTRNALIGQPVSTIEEMLLVWTIEEIEQLALDRTAQSLTTTIGVARPLGERFHLNADVTTSEIDGTVASEGVPATPATGQQIYYSMSLVGSGLFGAGDVTILNLRRGTADTFDLSQFTWDARFPVGRKIRLNPRLRYAVRENLVDGRTRDTASASFRLLLNLRNHYRLEMELGKDAITRTDAGIEQESSGAFFILGYRADF